MALFIHIKIKFRIKNRFVKTSAPQTIGCLYIILKLKTVSSKDAYFNNLDKPKNDN
jgi:hypothetical protein